MRLRPHAAVLLGVNTTQPTLIDQIIVPGTLAHAHVRRNFLITRHLGETLILIPP